MFNETQLRLHRRGVDVAAAATDRGKTVCFRLLNKTKYLLAQDHESGRELLKFTPRFRAKANSGSLGQRRLNTGPGSATSAPAKILAWYTSVEPFENEQVFERISVDTAAGEVSVPQPMRGGLELVNKDALSGENGVGSSFGLAEHVTRIRLKCGFGLFRNHGRLFAVGRRRELLAVRVADIVPELAYM